MKLKNKITLILLVLTSMVYASNTDSIFIKMPAKLLPTLNNKQRFELAEYYKAGSKDSVTNLFGTNCILNKYDTTACYIVVQTSKSTLTEILRIHDSVTKTNYLGVINTITQPLKYSSIQFFTENWKPYNKKIVLPELKQWFNSEKTLTSELTEELIKSVSEKSYLSFSFTDDAELSIQNNILGVLTNEEKKIITPIFEQKTIKLKLK